MATSIVSKIANVYGPGQALETTDSPTFATVTVTTSFIGPAGSVSAASVRGGTAGTGFFFPSSSEIGGAIGGSSYFRFNTIGFQGISTWVLGWGAGAANASAMVTGLSQVSAGVVGVGTGAAGSFAGSVKMTTLILAPLTVATLPATPAQGMRCIVTDANATTFLSIVAAGGANVVPVMYNGTNWVIG